MRKIHNKLSIVPTYMIASEGAVQLIRGTHLLFSLLFTVDNRNEQSDFLSAAGDLEF